MNNINAAGVEEHEKERRAGSSDIVAIQLVLALS